MENNNFNRGKTKSKKILHIVEIITSPFSVLLKRQALTSSTKSDINQLLILLISIIVVVALVLLYYRGVIFR